MDPTADDRMSLGESILDITEEPTDDPEVDLLAGRELVAAARGTPYVRRARALGDRTARDGPLPFHTASALWRAAAPTDHERGATGAGKVVDVGLVTTLAAGLLTGSAEDPELRIRPGPEAELVTGHPLAAWGESLTPSLLCDPVPVLELTPRWYDEAMGSVPCLLYQYVVKAGRPIPLAPVLEALHREALLVASRMSGPVPVPSHQRLAAQLRSLLVLQVEFGLVSWEPGDDVEDLGVVAPTGLGMFGWLVLNATIDGELPPSFQGIIERAGYLRANGGYVHRGDLPVPVEMN